jgi:hypothetical protein
MKAFAVVVRAGNSVIIMTSQIDDEKGKQRLENRLGLL